jgi:dodecin
VTRIADNSAARAETGGYGAAIERSGILCRRFEGMTVAEYPDRNRGGAGLGLRPPRARETAMNDHVYKTIEITGSSSKSADDAIRVAIEKASATVKNLRWFKVIETRGQVEGGKVAHWQVTVHLGFTLE